MYSWHVVKLCNAAMFKTSLLCCSIVNMCSVYMNYINKRISKLLLLRLTLILYCIWGNCGHSSCLIRDYKLCSNDLSSVLCRLLLNVSLLSCQVYPCRLYILSIWFLHSDKKIYTYVWNFVHYLEWNSTAVWRYSEHCLCITNVSFSVSCGKNYYFQKHGTQIFFSAISSGICHHRCYWIDLCGSSVYFTVYTTFIMKFHAWGMFFFWDKIHF